MIIFIMYYLEFRNGRNSEKWKLVVVLLILKLCSYSKCCLDIKISDHVSHHFDFGLCER